MDPDISQKAGAVAWAAHPPTHAKAVGAELVVGSAEVVGGDRCSSHLDDAKPRDQRRPTPTRDPTASQSAMGGNSYFNN